MAKKNEEPTYILDSKMALPNKLLQDDGTVTDITGNVVVNPVESYENKQALPNKFLNPDGTYSTLNEIIASMVDTSIYVIVDGDLPAEGDPQKIYLKPDGKGGFAEYHWTGDKWDPVGMLEFDLSDYSTTQEVMNAIEASALQTLNAAKAYTNTAIANIPKDIEVYYLNNRYSGGELSPSQDEYKFWAGLYNPTNMNPFVVIFEDGPNDGALYLFYFENHNFESGKYYIGYGTETGKMMETTIVGGKTDISVAGAEFSMTIENGEITKIRQGTVVNHHFVLETDCAYRTTFIPTQDYQPATKKYVDDSIATNVTNVLGGEY